MLHTKDTQGQSPTTVVGQCKARAAAGFQSGMGKIFVDVAAINPVVVVSPKSSNAGGHGHMRLRHRNQNRAAGVANALQIRALHDDGVVATLNNLGDDDHE
jgi:hypothetical protein